MAFGYRGRSEWLRDHPVAGPGDGKAFGHAVVVTTNHRRLNVIFSGGDECGWEHVSVSTPVRTPTWEEMCFVKSLFWDDEDCVMQLHPPRSSYVNNHPYCLHLWRPVSVEIPTPHTVLV